MEKDSLKGLIETIKDKIKDLDLREKIKILNYIRKELSKVSPQRNHPCDCIIWVESKKVQANEYNPNKVAYPEMKLLKHSIEEDGVTQPVVTFYDNEIDRYIIVDGFHRFFLLKKQLKFEYIPIVVIEKDIKDRMASTIRHNRARGVHKVDLMSELVLKLINLGWQDDDIAKHLGMEYDEVLRLKQMTGVAYIFRNREYSKSWEAKNG